MQDIENRWAAQLAREHRSIAWQSGVNLKTPIINISSGKKTLGSWNYINQTISISSHLIKTEIWDIVLEVLKHEMAHQYVSKFYNNIDRHGEYFKKACAVLGVHPIFITGSTDYNQKLQLFKGHLPAAAKKMLEKVEKLMALGQSTNEAEAQSASRKANYLLNKYNLDQINITRDNPDIKYLTICHKKKRIESIQKAVLSILRNYYYVNCLTSHTYDIQDDETYRSIILIGRREALKVAEYVYFFLLDTGKTLWQDFKNKTHAKMREKVSFDMGFIAGIDHNHKKMFEDSGSKIEKNSFLPVKTLKTLMEKNHRNNQIETARLFPKLTKTAYGRHKASSSAFKQGFNKGENTHIHKAVTHSGTGLGGLLTDY